MDPQVRNFRDFLLLYNKLTEMCFQHCTNNFFSRNLSTDETTCVDKCVLKFSNVNQKIMSNYVETQTAINQRRMDEIALQQQQAAAAEISSENPSGIAQINETASATTSVA